jgi:AbrB family looped-hinge helix DNA binding protein
MISAIETSIDASGRLVVPKAIREAAGLVAGVPLSIRVTESGIEIAPAPRAVRTVRRGRLTVAVPLDAGPALTTRAVRATQTRVRRER